MSAWTGFDQDFEDTEPHPPWGGRCVVWNCHGRPTETRATMTTAYRLCPSHALAWDEGRITGSVASGGYFETPRAEPAGRFPGAMSCPHCGTDQHPDCMHPED